MPEYRASAFELDEYFSPPLKGFTSGDRWNGFARPFFEKDECDRIAVTLGDLKFDENEDAYVCDMGYPDEEPEFFRGKDIEVGGVKHHVYPIGAGFWVWTEVDDYSD